MEENFYLILDIQDDEIKTTVRIPPVSKTTFNPYIIEHKQLISDHNLPLF